MHHRGRHWIKEVESKNNTSKLILKVDSISTTGDPHTVLYIEQEYTPTHKNIREWLNVWSWIKLYGWWSWDFNHFLYTCVFWPYTPGWLAKIYVNLWCYSYVGITYTDANPYIEHVQLSTTITWRYTCSYLIYIYSIHQESRNGSLAISWGIGTTLSCPGPPSSCHKSQALTVVYNLWSFFLTLTDQETPPGKHFAKVSKNWTGKLVCYSATEWAARASYLYTHIMHWVNSTLSIIYAVVSQPIVCTGKRQHSWAEPVSTGSIDGRTMGSMARRRHVTILHYTLLHGHQHFRNCQLCHWLWMCGADPRQGTIHPDHSQRS